MREPLNPISFEFFQKYLIYGNSLNLSMQIQLGCHINLDLLTQALVFLIDKHPILAARVVIDLNSKFRYFWEPIPEIKPIPLVEEELDCFPDSLQQELNNLETQRYNTTIPYDQTYPFQLFVTFYRDSLTHLQLVMPHAVGDGKSLAIILRDLLDFYCQLKDGKIPKIEPFKYFPGDWETFFGCSANSANKKRIEGIIKEDLQWQKLQKNNRDGDGRDWPQFVADLSAKNSPQKTELTLVPFPRPIIPESKKITDGFLSSSKVLHHTFSQTKVAQLQALRKNALFQTASGIPYSINELISALYIQTQLRLAKSAGENIKFIVLGMAFDLRPLLTEITWRFSIQNIFLPMVLELEIEEEMAENLALILKLINSQKETLLEKMPRASLEAILFRYQIGDFLEPDDWSLFLKTRNETLQNRIARILRLSYLGNITKFFRNLPNLNFLKVNYNTTIAGFPVSSLLIYLFNRQLSICYPYIPDFFNEAEVEMVWQTLIEAIDGLGIFS